MTSNSALLPRPALGLRALAAVLALVALVAVGLALVPARASAAAPSYFVGLQGWSPPTTSQMTKVRGARVQSYRIQLNWGSVERRRPVAGSTCRRGETRSGSHCYSWSGYDSIFARAAARGLRVLPVVVGTPSWVSSRQTTPPLGSTARRAYNDFTRAAARRYGPNGTFWAGRGVPKAFRAHYWQIWNEPNLPNYWNGRPNPAEYASFLSGASDAANRGDSEARIVVGGMPYSTISGTIDPRDFLRGMFRADPGIYTKFTAVGLHPYARTPSLVLQAVRAMRVTMNDIGRMGGKSLYLTEFGWATGRPDGRFQVSESTQARYLREALTGFIGARSRYNIKGAFWFSLIDLRNPWFWGERTGLLRSDGSHKPSWTSLKRVTGAP
ncbi:MAG TPA: hypothetical protein VGV57_12205 [Thermoleophilaceae bacterium]|nr:hypothetical protein [Thermoleophilaceae bacterium]